jgi:DNA-binding PadR family transcriptional regulator
LTDQTEKLKKLSPLTETSFYVLISLLEPLHGYGVMQKVEKLSNGRIKFGPGTLYGALNNLQEIGLIMPHETGGETDRRKTYKITQTGMDLVEFEISRLEEMILNAKTLLAESRGYAYGTE